MKKYVWGLLLFTTSWVQGQDQDPYAVLQRLAAVYSNKGGLSYTVEYAYYKAPEARLPDETMKMEVATKGDAYRVQYHDYILFGDGKQHLVIDHLTQSMRFTEAVPQSGVLELQQFQEMAETMGLQLRFFDPKAGDGKGLEFTAPDHSKTSIRLVYDPATYRLKSNSICIDLPEEHGRGYPFNKMYLEVSYSNYQEINGKFPYRLDDFVKRAGKNDYRPVEGYGKYVVMF